MRIERDEKKKVLTTVQRKKNYYVIVYKKSSTKNGMRMYRKLGGTRRHAARKFRSTLSAIMAMKKTGMQRGGRGGVIGESGWEGED